MNHILEIIMIFAVYSFLGWTLETVFAMFINRKFVKRGFLKGPFCPIYGFGGVVMALTCEGVSSCLLNKYEATAAMFVIIFFVASLLEYITGMLLTLLFDKKWWDK